MERMSAVGFKVVTIFGVSSNIRSGGVDRQKQFPSRDLTRTSSTLLVFGCPLL